MTDGQENKEKSLSEYDLKAVAEDFYFWLMRSTSEPKIYSDTFQLLSQIMRIAQISNTGRGDYLSKNVVKEAFSSLSNIKEQVQDGKIQFQNLFSTISQVLQKLIHENPKAQLIAHATEIEYIFCIHSTYSSSCEAAYQQKFKGYLKTIVDTVNSDLSLTQTKAIVQILSQIVKNPSDFSKDPHKKLMESLKKSGIIVIDRPTTEEPKTA